MSWSTSVRDSIKWRFRAVMTLVSFLLLVRHEHIANTHLHNCLGRVSLRSLTVQIFWLYSQIEWMLRLNVCLVFLFHEVIMLLLTGLAVSFQDQPAQRVRGLFESRNYNDRTQDQFVVVNRGRVPPSDCWYLVSECLSPFSQADMNSLSMLRPPRRR